MPNRHVHRALLVYVGTIIAACSGGGVGSGSDGSTSEASQDGARADGTFDSSRDTGGSDALGERASDGGGLTDTPTGDSTRFDVVNRDAGGLDVVTRDTAIQDTATRDTAVQDVITQDTVVRDVVVQDTAVQDTGIQDSGVIHPTTDIAMTIDTSQRRYAIPGNYVGISFPRENISGQNGLRDLFVPGSATENQLVSLYQQIGIRHIRVLSHDSSVQDPSDQQNDDFFAFAQQAQIPSGSIIYSLNDENLPSGYNGNNHTAVYLWTYHRGMIESFAIGNEPDWFIPSIFSTYTTFRQTWVSVHGGVETALGVAGLPSAPFSGPDTGSNAPARLPSTAVNGVYFTNRFANDELNRISYATQHYYGGDTREAPPWSSGTNYYAGDAILDANGFTYQCTQDDLNSTQDPSTSGSWRHFPPRWSSSMSYSAGQYVQDPNHLGTDYLCVSGCPASGTSPSNQPTTVWQSEREALLSAYQMAHGMLDATWVGQYQTLFDQALAGATNATPPWPTGLGYRMTEGNAYSWGKDTNNHLFALALWAVDFFHWWAAHGCLGVDPFTILNFYNAPIYDDAAAGGIVAEPYAYGMLAFGQGMAGTTIPRAAVTLSASPTWLTLYPVVGAGHLYITFVNKTFNRIGSHDASVTISASPFTAVHARLIRLESAPGATGDATVDTATLGGQTIVTNGQWAGTWETVPVGAGGMVGPVLIRATSAVVLDITNY